MISVMIQAVKKDENNVVALDGKILEGAEAKRQAEAIFDDIDGLKFKGEGVQKSSDNTKLVCRLYHPEKDEVGRTRGAIVVWEKGTSQELIKQTLEVMGLDFNRFKALYEPYESKAKRQGLIVGVAVLAVVGIALMLALKSS